MNLISIHDIILMLRRRDRPIDWNLVLKLLPDSALVADYLSVILLFLDAERIQSIPTTLSRVVQDSACRIGAINLFVLHWLLRTFPLGGKKQVGILLTSRNARIVWKTLLEPRAKLMRLPVAALRMDIF